MHVEKYIQDDELTQWAELRADDAGRLARELVLYRNRENGWQPFETAPKDRRWVLIRGRNSVGQPTIPVVGAWMPFGAQHQGWVDSGSFKPLDGLTATPGAEWMDIP